MPTTVTFPATFPVTLGEAGRGRTIVTIHQAPAAATGAALITMKTSRAYTRRRASGEVMFWGAARELAHGSWAHGDAGRIADGPDVLLALTRGSRAAISTIGGDSVREYFFWDGGEIHAAASSELKAYAASRSQAQASYGDACKRYDTLLTGFMGVLGADADEQAPNITAYARAVGLGPSQVPA